MRATGALGILTFVGVMTAAALGVRSMPVPSVGLQRHGEGVEGDRLDWRARVSPADDRLRFRASVDRGPVEVPQPWEDDGVALAARTLAPGPHFVELSLDRRGGRSERVTDEVWAGPWQAEHARGCDVGLQLTPEGLRALLLPVVEAKLLAGARDNPYFGQTSTLTRADLEVVDGGLRFAVFLDTDEEDKGDLSVAGVIDVRGQGEAGITAKLRVIEQAAPGPKLEQLARDEGGRRLGAIGVTVGGGLAAAAGGGVLLGLAAAAGGGLLGSRLGETVGERTARREVEREAAQQIERALAVATDAIRLPSEVELLPTTPALRADLRWCDEPTLVAGEGLRARLRVVLHEDEASERAAAQAVHLGTALPEPSAPIPAGANLHVDVSGDFVNRLLAEWGARGGLQDHLDASGLRQEVQAVLGERTRWEVAALRVERPPVLWLGDETIRASLGSIALELLDPERARARTVVLGARGSVTLRPEPEPGRVRLGGTASEVYFGCREGEDEGEDEGESPWRRPCFAAVVDPERLREQIDQQLHARSDRLPVLDLGGVLRLETFGEGTPRAIDLRRTWVTARPGRLSIDARVE